MDWRPVTQARRSGRGYLASMVVVLGAGAFALGLSAGGFWENDALAGTQQCNTACQSKMTDCILACDGVLECELACKTKAVACVVVCTSDAGPMTTSSLDATSEASEASTDAGRPKDAARDRVSDDARRARARDE